MVENYIVIRAIGDGTTINFGPKEDDLAPYAPYEWEDVSARAYNLQGQDAHDAMMADPRVMVIRLRTKGPDAVANSVAMSNDNKLWRLASRVIDDETGEVTNNDLHSVYSPQERTDRISSLVSFFGLTQSAIESRWPTDATRTDVAKTFAKWLGKRESDPDPDWVG